DPYAIDLDDDDDAAAGDLLTALPRTARQEESLVDFLAHAEPPRDNGPRPLVTGGGAQARSAMNKARVNSMNSLRSVPGAPHAGGAKTVQSAPGPQPRPSSGRPVSGAAAAAIPSSEPPAAPKPRLEPRSPGEVAVAGSRDRPAGDFGAFSKQSNTRDLADFLKNSGPGGP
ncbi:hypothetical protein LTR53_018949, partial [Teratosphaeriaceae sp. CCFEE 6253]